ncbi:MAG: acetamidase [Chloroflexi bacterium]|nr:acetamidase [Chloroflexota bacterium]
MATHRLEPQMFYYTFGPHEPALRIRSGDVVIAETRDAWGQDAEGNPLPDEMKERRDDTELRESNPVLGPLYVEDAEPGDLLAVEIQRIRVSRDWAPSRQGPNFGSLTGEGPGRRLLYNDPIPEIWYRWKLDLEAQTGSLDLPNSRVKHVTVPMHPFIGSIGVAPRYGRVEPTLTPGEYGGNMDSPDTHEGTTLYLPVWVRGAYLSYGDVHAFQSDGELNGTAAEVTAEITLRVEVLKGVSAEWPRMEDATHIMVAGSTRPLWDCMCLAQMELLRWLVEGYGFDREEAWQLNAQVGTMRIANVVDPNYTVMAKFPKAYLPR